MMYTKDGEFEVSLIGGSPWGFGIRSQSGNAVNNRPRIIVKEIVQGGKADISGNIHVGDEIITINGLQFDNEQQATKYVKDARKELILRLRRGQDRRRMNIRLTGDFTNYFSEALEKPYEKEVYAQKKPVSNNKRSSKEFEIDLGYSNSIETINPTTDYHNSNRSQVTRLTRSVSDLSEVDQVKDHFIKDDLSSSQQVKAYDSSNNPEKGFQRILRVQSVNVSPLRQYKHTTDNELPSPTSSFDGNYKMNAESSHSSTSGNVQKPYRSSSVEALNRTWPSAENSETIFNTSIKSEISGGNLPFVVSGKSSDEELHYPMVEGRTSLSLAPKPPSRNSSFRATRRSSSSSVFSDSSERKPTSPSPTSPSQISYYNPSYGSVSGGETNSLDDLDKPLPPRRYSKSVVMNSIRSKKQGSVKKTATGETVHHTRTQSLPHYMKTPGQHSPVEAIEISSEMRLPRSSSFSRVRVLETGSVQTIRADIQEPFLRKTTPSTTAMNNITTENVKPSYAIDLTSRGSSDQGTVIQALKTGEISSTNEEPNEAMADIAKSIEAEDEASKTSNLNHKSTVQFHSKREKQPKSILKRDISRPQVTKVKSQKPFLKENSFMTRLLQESHAEGGNAATAAIEKEIKQLTGKTGVSVKSNFNVKHPSSQNSSSEVMSSKAEIMENVEHTNQETNNVEKTVSSSYFKKEDEPCLQHVKTSGSASSVKNVFTQSVQHPNDDVVLQKMSPVSYFQTVKSFDVELKEQPIESNIDDDDEIIENVLSSNDDKTIGEQEENSKIQFSFSTDKSIHENMSESVSYPRMQVLDEAKHDNFISSPEIPVKSGHSRENSASSLLEETLESAKTIASIYSVQGPTRTPDGEDLMSTATQMRRQSLAKRGNRRRTKLDLSNITPERTMSEPSTEISKDETAKERHVENRNNNERELSGQISYDEESRHNTLLSPKLGALEEQKGILISSMQKKIELLKDQENEVKEEMNENDLLGKRVSEKVKEKTTSSEFSKYELFVGELNNIIGLLLSLTQRMHRYEVMLEDIDLNEENGRTKRDVLLKSMDRVKCQYEEACRIKEINDKRGETVSKIVEESCRDEEFADFQHFVDMKTQLALTQAEIRDKIKLGEEKLQALNSAHIDWAILDLSIK